MRAFAPLLPLLLPALALADAAAPGEPLLPAPPAPATGTAAEAPAAAAAIDAVGMVRSPTPGRSVVILRCEGRTRVVAVGETAFGARLTAIGPETVSLVRDGRAFELRLAAVPAAPPAPRPAATAADSGRPPEDPATPPREMDRRQVQVRLGEEMNRILAETAIAPVLEEGRVVGVQLTRVPEGSLLTDAGLRQGDVLTRINDTQIDGMASLIGLWPRLQGASDLRAVVLRAGQPVSLRVTLR
jgi:type II secretion system protein C